MRVIAGFSIIIALSRFSHPPFPGLFFEIAKMSVFSLDVDKSNPVTGQVVDELCQTLGITMKDEEKSDYQRLLAIFHQSASSLMVLPGISIGLIISRSTD